MKWPADWSDGLDESALFATAWLEVPDVIRAGIVEKFKDATL
jgi:hypothetical protein